MKYLVNVIFVILVFTGCGQQKQLPMKTIGMDKVKKIDTEKSIKQIPSSDSEKIEIENFEFSPFEEEKKDVSLENKEHFDIVFMYSSKNVNNYIKSSISTIMGYLSYRKINYNFKIIDTNDQNEASIQKAFNQVEKEEIKNVIALFTPSSIATLNKIATGATKVYLPLIKKNENFSNNENFIFGSICYEDQVKTLFDYVNKSFPEGIFKAEFYEKTYLSTKIKYILKNQNIFFGIKKELKKERSYYRTPVFSKRLNDSIILLNTSIVKTSLLLSQFRAYEIEPKINLMLQNNYNPKLIELTQYEDRKNILIVNSIDELDNTLDSELYLYDSNSNFNWVNYSILVGINYLYNKNNDYLLPVLVKNNEVEFKPKLFVSKRYGFFKLVK